MYLSSSLFWLFQHHEHKSAQALAVLLATGNLLVLRDGRVGYIDFGIVGRVAPSMWAAVEALLGSAASGDFVTMARALCTLGVTATDVDIPVRARHSF